MKSRRLLGATARTGKRTGAIEVDEYDVARITRAIVDTFEYVQTGAGEYCLHPDKPKQILSFDSLVVKNAATGDGRAVYVYSKPKDIKRGDANGFYENLTHSDRLVIEPNKNRCYPRALWELRLRSKVAHELAHGADPVLNRKQGPHPSVDYCKYVNSSVELPAFVAMVHDEVNHCDYAEPGLRPDQLLEKSPTFMNNRPCWTERARRRFLRMAARTAEALEERCLRSRK